MLANKRINLPKLQAELNAAGVPYRVLMAAPTDVDGQVNIHDQDDKGEFLDLPQSAQSVIDAHVAPLPIIEFAGTAQVSSIVRTVDDVVTEVFRLDTQPKHIYRVTVRLTAVDAGNGTCKDAEARILFKRLANSVVQVGSTVVISVMQDTQAQTWNIVPGISGTDFIISVRGAVGRTIDWLLFGDVGTYAPEGLPV